jgi:hypothetical protein
MRCQVSQVEKFARLVADGAKQVDAYISTHGTGPSRKAQTEMACKLAAKPHVQARIQELRNLQHPVLDYKAVREEMLSNMRFLAKESPDQRVRLAATKMLHDICEDRVEKLESKKPGGFSPQVSHDLDKLVREVFSLARPEIRPAIDLQAEAQVTHSERA